MEVHSWLSWPPVKAPSLILQWLPTRSVAEQPEDPVALRTFCCSHSVQLSTPILSCPLSTVHSHPPFAVTRPSPLHPSSYICYGHFKIRLLMWVFFLLAGIAQLAGIAHIFRIRSRLSKYHSSLSAPKCSCYCWEHCVTTAPPHALGWISSVLFGCQLNTSSSGSPSHTSWPWGAVLCVSQAQSWFPRAVDHMVCFSHVCHFPQEQRPWWKESCLQCLVCDS